MDLAANLGIATANPFTELCHYIIATLDITTSNFCTYTVYIGFCDYGLSGQSGFSDRKPLDHTFDSIPDNIKSLPR